MNATTARFRYHGAGRSLLGLVIVNFLLTILTLGIYSFWAKNKIREFHYSHTEMDGDRFAYHGTGGELFRGALKAFGILLAIGLVFLGITRLVGGPAASPAMQVIPMAFLYITVGLLVPIAINGARRYRLTRSSWRGVRFSFHGKPGEFLGLMVKGTLLTIVTIGFYAPYFQNERRAFLVNNARFGSEPFLYKAGGGELFRKFLIALLLTIPTLGVYWIWYAAFAHRFFWSNTTMRGARFRSTVTGGDLFVLKFTNALLVIFTLGIGAAWAITRTHEFYCEKLTLHGTVDWASIQQRAQDATATGEGLAEGLDVGVDIG